VERVNDERRRAIQPPELATLARRDSGKLQSSRCRDGRFFGFLDDGREPAAGRSAERAVLTIRNGQVVWDSEG